VEAALEEATCVVEVEGRVAVEAEEEGIAVVPARQEGGLRGGDRGNATVTVDAVVGSTENETIFLSQSTARPCIHPNIYISGEKAERVR